MSPTLNGSSAIRRFERSVAIEIRDGITFDFYLGLPHIICFLTAYTFKKDAEIMCILCMYVLVVHEDWHPFKVARFPVFSRSKHLESKLIEFFVFVNF